MQKTKAVLVGALLAAGSLSGATAATASAAPAIETYESVKYPGECMDDTDQGFRVWSCNGTDAQQWRVEVVGSVRIFHNVKTGRCMDDTDDGFKTWSCNGSTAQQWGITNNSDGSITMQNLRTHRCIDNTVVDFRTWNCNRTVAQHWK